MKTTRIIAAGALLVPLLAGAQQGLYMGVHAGVNDLNGWSHTVDFGNGITVPGDLSVDRGVHWGVAVGRQMQPWRAELEFQQGDFDIKGVQLGPVSATRDSNGTYRTLMLNGYGAYQVNQPLSLYAGAGLGWGSVKVSAMPPLQGCDCYREAKKSGFAWQLRAGVEYDMGSPGRLFAQYTYLRLPAASSGDLPSVRYERKDVNAIELGYRKLF